MRRPYPLLLALGVAAAPASAQTGGITDAPSSLTLSGTAAVVSDYRFRGVSLSAARPAVQASVTATHVNGVYAGAFASSLEGYGSFGKPGIEVDLYAGYRRTAGPLTLDGGVIWYLYPSKAEDTTVAELYGSASGTLGPGTLKLGVNYAPRQRSLANVSAAANSRGQRQDNLYLSGDASAAVVGTPLTVRAHLGYSDGNPGLGPNATSLSPTGAYVDYAIGVDAQFGRWALGLAYVDTDIGRSEARRLQPSLSRGQDGTGSIVEATFVASLTASF